jgi:hypothetical protein
MSDSILYHEATRALQDRFDSRRIADRLEELVRTEFSADDRAYIESAYYFFLATAEAGLLVQGRPQRLRAGHGGQ